MSFQSQLKGPGPPSGRLLLLQKKDPKLRKTVLCGKGQIVADLPFDFTNFPLEGSASSQNVIKQ